MSSDAITEAIIDTYSRAAQTETPEPCCTTGYDSAFTPAELDHLPAEVLAKNYGCGVPSKLRSLEPGQHILDLGPGLGRDCFIAARKVGSTGQVFGLDMNPKMLAAARRNSAEVAQRLGYDNVKFLEGRFDERIPLPEDSVDVIFSNCVNNLAQDKAQAYREMFRVLKPGAALSFSDVVVDRPNPDLVRNHPQAVADCLGGALCFKDLRQALQAAGFVGVRMKVEALFRSGKEVLKLYFEDHSLSSEQQSEIAALGYFSVNVLALKHRYTSDTADRYQGHRAVYHGPAPHFSLDQELKQTFRLGEWVQVGEKTAWLLRQEPYAAQFTVIDPEGAAAEDNGCQPGCC